jgi:hypothetical protein
LCSVCSSSFKLQHALDVHIWLLAAHQDPNSLRPSATRRGRGPPDASAAGGHPMYGSHSDRRPGMGRSAARLAIREGVVDAGQGLQHGGGPWVADAGHHRRARLLWHGAGGAAAAARAAVGAPTLSAAGRCSGGGERRGVHRAVAAAPAQGGGDWCKACFKSGKWPARVEQVVIGAKPASKPASPGWRRRRGARWWCWRHGGASGGDVGCTRRTACRRPGRRGEAAAGDGGAICGPWGGVDPRCDLAPSSTPSSA